MLSLLLQDDNLDANLLYKMLLQFYGRQQNLFVLPAFCWTCLHIFMTTFYKYYYFHSLKHDILEALVYIYYELEHYDILVTPENSRHLCADNLASEHKRSHSGPVDYC